MSKKTNKNTGPRATRAARGASSKPQAAAPARPGTKAKSAKPARAAAEPAKPASRGKPKKAAPWMPDLPPAKPAGRGASRPAAAPPSRPPRAADADADAAPLRFQDPHAAREAQRYADPIPSREAILKLLAEADGPMLAEAVADALGLDTFERREALGKRLGAMVRDGQLLQNRRGGYAPAERLDLIPGTVIANRDGFGFLRPEGTSGDDLFLPPMEMRKVMHGDRVMVSVTGMDRRGRREAAIVEVLERRLTRLIGRFTLEAGISYVVPDDARIHRNVQIPADERMDARNGQLVVCEIVHAPDAYRPPIGRVLTVLGDKLTPSLVVEAGDPRP